MALLDGDHEIGRAAAHVLVGAVLLQLPQHVGDVLETDQQVLDQLRAESPRDARHQARRHLGPDHDGRRRQPAELVQLVELEVRQQGRDLVAADNTPRPAARKCT